MISVVGTLRTLKSHPDNPDYCSVLDRSFSSTIKDFITVSKIEYTIDKLFPSFSYKNFVTILQYDSHHSK